MGIPRIVETSPSWRSPTTTFDFGVTYSTSPKKRSLRHQRIFFRLFFFDGDENFRVEIFTSWIFGFFCWFHVWDGANSQFPCFFSILHHSIIARKGPKSWKITNHKFGVVKSGSGNEGAPPFNGLIQDTNPI